MRRCAAGRTTSGTRSPGDASRFCGTSRGDGSSPGNVSNTAGAGPRSPGGCGVPMGRGDPWRPRTWCSSIPPVFVSSGTGIEARASPTPTRSPPERRHPRGEPVAVRAARRVRRAARGNGTTAMPSPRPGPTQHVALRERRRGRVAQGRDEQGAPGRPAGPGRAPGRPGRLPARDAPVRRENRAETTTLIPVLTQFQARHGITDMVVVADAGMLSAANLNALEDAGFSFIVGSRLTKAPYDLAAHFERKGTFFTDGQILESVRVMGTGKAARSRRIVYQWSFKRNKRDDRTINLMIAKAEKIASGAAPLKKARFLT